MSTDPARRGQVLKSVPKSGSVPFRMARNKCPRTAVLHAQEAGNQPRVHQTWPGFLGC